MAPLSATGTLGRRSAPSSLSSVASTSSSQAKFPAYKSKRKPKRSQRRQRRTQTALAVRALLVVLLLVALVDLYFVWSLKGHGKSFAKDVAPLVKEQVDSVLHRHHNQHNGAPQSYSNEQRAFDRLTAQQLINRDFSKQFQPLKPLDDTTDVDADKEEVYEILKQAGIDWKTLSREDRYMLPTWTRVQELYGKEPVFVGLERCEDFTRGRDMSTAFFGIAGTFNSGTNLLAEMLIQNCQITERMQVFGERQKGIRWQVPWGKHTPVKWRWQHVTTTDREVPVENSFPMLTIRDPYFWLGSMCRHPYALKWAHNRTVCPNLVLEDGSINKIWVKYKEGNTYHDSMIHHFNEWYQDYLDVDFPRVFVRFEDLLFYGKNLTETLCKCGGGVPRRDHFVHVQDSAKIGTAAHGSHKTGLLQALQRYGNFDHRLDGMTADDIRVSKQLFDPKLMEMFDYHHPAETVGRPLMEI